MHIVHTEASLGWGGQEIRILEESAGMIARGHRVILLAPRDAQIFRQATERGIPAVALPIGRKNLCGLLALRRWMKNHPVDIINTHSSTDSWLAALACATLGGGPPLVRTRHISAPIPNNRATRWLYCSATRRIVTTGANLRAQLIRDNGYPGQRITSVPTGIDSALFAPGDRQAARRRLSLPQNSTLIGIVATLRDWKGHRYLIEAFTKLDRPDARLVIVGDGPQRQNIEARIRELSIGERVWLAGNQTDVLPWLQAFDIFALPSYANEGVPQALVQAMLCGLPCVTTATGSTGEVARDGDTAIIVRPEDVADLRRGLERLLADAPLRARLGDRARLHCVASCGVEDMLERMEKVFLDAAQAAV